MAEEVERLATLEANIRNILHQLDDLRENVGDLHRLTTAVEKLATQKISTEKFSQEIKKLIADRNGEIAFDEVKPLLECMGHPVYTGGPASGSVTKLVNNMIAGAYLVAMAEGYAFAAKAGIDLQTTFDATRCGFAGGPLYDNKIPKLIVRDYEPGARIAVHQKDIHNAKNYAHKLGVDLPMTDVVCHVMDWMEDNGYVNEDQIAMVRYYEAKMGVTAGEKPEK